MTNALLHMATLLRAGLDTEAVWAAIDEPPAHEVCRRVRSGVPVHQAVAALEATGEWAVISDVWSYASRTGIPRAEICEVVGAALENLRSLRRAAETARSGTQMSVRVLAALPPVGVVMAALMGLDTFGFMVGTGLGWSCASVGAGLSVWGWRWMARLVADVPLPELTTGVLCDLAAHTVRSGISGAAMVSALEPLAARWSAADQLEVIRTVAQSSRSTGMPMASALAAWADSLRRGAADAAQRAIEQLPSRLVVPVGVCLFPAFILLVVVPTVVAMASRTLAA